METKEYIVSLKKGVDYDKFWAEMESPTNGLEHVPDRVVDIKNERPGSLRSCHYLLTDSEANTLRNDPRVYSVEIPPSQRSDIKIGFNLTQLGNFEKTASPVGPFQNWGLVRSLSENNNFGESTLSGRYYDYVLDGTGVDIVILDSGVEAQHPEFTNLTNETSRVREIDWYEAAGLATFDTIDLSTSTKSSVSSNSYINFQKDFQVAEGYFSSNLGSSLVLGPKVYFDGFSNDPAMKALYTATENSGRSYRIRYEGWIDFENTDGDADLIWEVTFFDSNTLQVLVVRHDDPVNSNWLLNLPKSFIELTAFQNATSLVGGVGQKSMVFTTGDGGNTWLPFGSVTNNFRVVDDGGNWVVEAGLATELGTSGMTVEAGPGNFDESLYPFNTPFTFNAGYASDSEQPAYFYRDLNGHGTHVAGIAAGKTFGWAKNAEIYSMKILGLEGVIDNGNGIDINEAFDLVKLWHQNKPVDPTTGIKRPTIANMSFGYTGNYVNITGGNYRGTPWTDTVRKPEYGMVADVFPIRVSSVDVDLQEMITAGIHVCVAAGNYYHKVDAFGGLDYDNYWTNNVPTNIYYHRGSSPYDDQAFIVGNIDSDVFDVNNDQKAELSEAGPGVDLYAPGTNIVSATSVINELTGFEGAYWPTSFQEVNFWRQANISGTSMASPQVCGVGALMLQIRPELTPDELKAYIMANATTALHTTGLDNDYEDHRSLHGGTAKVLFHKFGVNKSFSIRFGGNS